MAGYARILPFDARRGAAYYCAKYVAKQVNDWALSDNLAAFAQYQPVLPLEGGSKARASCAEITQRENQSKVRTNHKQIPMPYLLRGIWSPRDRGFSSVYRSEVTRGRGKFRDFGTGV